jgi:hypothetical protein
VRVGSLVLLHSPLAGAGSWGRLPEVLRASGYPVAVPSVTADDSPPYAHRYIAAATLQLTDADSMPPLVLVGHSGAGPLLPQLAAAAGAGGQRVGGYVFLDAGIPRLGADRLALLESEDPAYATGLRNRLDAGGRFPEWSDADLTAEVPDPGSRRELVASIRPRGLDYWTEPVPMPADWPDAPCGYAQLSPAYDASARQAGARGWPVWKLQLGHFAALAEPERVAGALLAVLEAM